MALLLVVIVIISNLSCLLGSKGLEKAFMNGLKITPSTIAGGRYFGLYEVEDTLNLSCIYSDSLSSENVALDWILPSKTSNRPNHIISHINSNLVNLVIENLTENDSGEYKCKASIKSLWNSERTIGINVKNRKGECSDMMFQCSYGKCIHKRFTCDGLKDCNQGEDELANYCGPGNPCSNKLKCPDGRCIPYSWCCDFDREQNCTTKVKHSCCAHMEKLTHDMGSDVDFQFEGHRLHDMGFLKTTVYTVIGCAMAFMFIVTIIVIATCRIHVRRSIIGRLPVGNNRSTTMACNSNFSGYQLNYLPFYDLDIYFNRLSCNNSDLMSDNPLLVTYNVDNGVQFIGRPIDPPPYCETLSTPPKEDPPPPYASQESLHTRRNSAEPKEDLDVELNESHALLGSSNLNQISVISSSAIDNEEHISKSTSTEQQTNYHLKNC